MKRLLIMLSFIPLCYYSSGQTFRAGFYIGAAATDVDGTDNVDNDNDFYHLGFTAAGTVSTKISPSTTFQMEIRFIQKGTQQPPVVDSVPNSALNIPNAGYAIKYNDYYTLTLNYVDIVLGIKHAIHFSIRNKTTDRYGFEAGLSVGTLVGYSYSVQSINYTMDLNLIDVSPYVGLYYNVTPHFYIEGRYSNSVNSIVKHDAINTPYFNYLWYSAWNAGHNLAFTLTLGFNLGGGGEPAGTAQPTTDTPPNDNQ